MALTKQSKEELLQVIENIKKVIIENRLIKGNVNINYNVTECYNDENGVSYPTVQRVKNSTEDIKINLSVQTENKLDF